MHPTPEQLAALTRYRNFHGRAWKGRLQAAWINGALPSHDAALLQQLRNQFGPPWLLAYRPGDTRVGKPAKSCPPGRKVLFWVIVDLDDRLLACRDGVSSKRDLRLVARSLGITLIETLS